MSPLKIALLIASFLFIDIAFAASNDLKNDNLQYTFVESRDGYAFKGKFFVVAKDSCLMGIIYEPEHLKKILKNRCTVNIVSKGRDTHVLSYIYKLPLIEIKSTYRKTLRFAERKVIFDMTGYEQKGVFLPRVLSSQGSYQITQEKYGYWVGYYQECKIDNSGVRSIFLFFAKSEAIKFLKDLKAYAERTCH